MNFYKRHLGDYAKDTGHLTMLEHGAYTLLLDRYYATEAPIPQAEVYRVCRAREKPEKVAVDTVLGEFFQLDEAGCWHSNRADAEIDQASKRRALNQEVGKLGGRPRKTQPETDSLFDDETESVLEKKGSQTPDSRLQTPTPNPAGALGGFAEFWSAWPKSTRKGGKAECEKLWRSGKLGSVKTAIVDHVGTMARSEDWTKENGRYIPAPAVYLRQQRWDGADDGGGQRGLSQPGDL